MSLSRVSVTAVRNLHPVTFSPSPASTFFTAPTAAAKPVFWKPYTCWGLPVRFVAPVCCRSSSMSSVPVLCLVRWSWLRGHSALGISRDRQGEFQIRIDGQNARSAAQLAEILPLQLINPDSFRLLEGAPKIRRQFLDWGVFHVEPRFMSTWQRLQKALRQRNSWLRHGTLDAVSQAVWDRELCQASAEIDEYRRAYIKALKPVFEQTLSELVELEGLTLSYYRGWDKDRELSAVLAGSVQRDQQMGHTQAGPQRADLRLRLGAHNAADILSRGQQKLVVCALRIAQGHLVSQARRGQCIYLVDDLPSELDEQHRRALCRLLEDLRCQVFITCVDHELLREGWQTETPVALFHVEQGRITQTHDHRE